MPSGIGAAEIIIIALILILLFGSKRVPEFIKGLGEAIEEYRRAVKED